MICNIKFKHRFFLLLDVFMRSSHLPEYIAGSFVKMLSRLLLYAPAPSSVLLLKIIHNLLHRFSSLTFLYDKDDQTDRDAFRFTAADLKDTKACDSSLWEVVTLRHSSPHHVYKAGRFIEFLSMPQETHIPQNLLELDYDDVSISDNFWWP